MPLYVADYLADTAHLDATASGAYLHLIMHYWQNGGLPDDDRQLARIAKVSSHNWKKLCPVIRKFFHDGWKHKRVEEELLRADEISGKRSEAAKAGHERRRANVGANAQQKQTQSQSQPQESIPAATAADAIASQAPSADLTLFPETRPDTVFTDSKHQLWAEGTAILESLGVPAKRGRPMIGRWMRDSKDDALAVLSAMQRARENRVQEPVAWITRAIATGQGPPAGRPIARTVREQTAQNWSMSLENLGKLADHFESRSSGDGSTGGADVVPLLPAPRANHGI
jgi:uncharacterized protein YdaU (DUF1376 family)